MSCAEYSYYMFLTCVYRGMLSRPIVGTGCGSSGIADLEEVPELSVSLHVPCALTACRTQVYLKRHRYTILSRDSGMCVSAGVP